MPPPHGLFLPPGPESPFGRPMSPAPAPLVFINGLPGVGKQAVAECLTLLLGPDKSLLVDVRGLGSRDDKTPLTPEHPGYFDFDAPLSAAASQSSNTRCSGVSLTSQLQLPSNVHRIAILAAYAPDTPIGRTAVRTFELAASRAGRLFIPITLTCEPAEHERRAGSLQRQCSHKSRGPSTITTTATDQQNNSQDDGGDTDETNSIINNTEAKAKSDNRPRPLSVVPRPRNGMTVDTTSAPAFEMALNIVEFVKQLVADRDAELCNASPVTTPLESMEPEWRHLGAR
ncbi:hypothetical protein B0H63DRAFT_516986 [Podospora didyma]|uniref:Uncharacterized protein n=1 Tax=Podospora didyma TaxID=330526 RepID=A0AAE0P5Q1_9PEZI|nr:hypothetical protein B0H63DRAFT_516986 [Podospora didyma]